MKAFLFQENINFHIVFKELMACQICGKKAGYYPLCKECNQLKEEGKISKCIDCGKWN
jgi:hypothetical protein